MMPTNAEDPLRDCLHTPSFLLRGGSPVVAQMGTDSWVESRLVGGSHLARPSRAPAELG